MQPPEGARRSVLPERCAHPVPRATDDLDDLAELYAPWGTSTRPVCGDFAGHGEDACVPLLLSEPCGKNHLPPLRTMGAMLAKVSTLSCMSVGLPQRPLTAGYGAAVWRAAPALDEASSAVSSPQTKAPAPRRISTSKLKGVLQITAAQQAAAPRVSRSAVVSRETATGTRPGHR